MWRSAVARERVAVRVSRWDADLAVRLPQAMVERLGLKEGDQIEIEVAGTRAQEVGKEPAPGAMLARLRRYRGRLPDGFRFHRCRTNERG